MTIGDDVRDLMGLWHNTDERLKVYLANIWIDREEGDNIHWKTPLDFSVEIFPKEVSLSYKTIKLDPYTKILTIEGFQQ